MSLYTWVYGGVVPVRLLPRRRDLGALRRLHGFLLNGSLGLGLLLLLAATRPWRVTAVAPTAEAEPARRDR